MGCIRPATPGFVVTLIATILLAVVSFCVPYFKTIFFLKANISVGGVSGNITFGTLGYCLELANGTTCSKPTVGYELDINSLVGNKLPIEIPQIAVKWLTTALVLHIVALGLAAGSAVFGLLAHVREMAMTCCSTCVSGFAAVVAMLAFIFDLVLFFVAKARINAVGSAQIGNAIWLTLAAWLLLFFSGCFYTLGRCCISTRSSRGVGGDRMDGRDWMGRKKDPESMPGGYADPMRLDAVKAEADRKARQKAGEVGLPAFPESLPLTGHVDGDHVVFGDPYKDGGSTPTSSYGRSTQALGYAGGGYVQGAPGSRAVDEYYAPTRTPSAAPNTYPPPSQQQYQAHGQEASYGTAPSGYGQNMSPPPQNTNGYAPVIHTPSPQNYSAPMTMSPPPINQQYPGQYDHVVGASYHSATSHQQQTSGYSQHDPYTTHQYAEPTYNQADYNHNAYTTNSAMPAASGYATDNSYYTSPPPPQQYAHDRSYTLRGDGYGANSVPPLQDQSLSQQYDTGYASSQPYTGPVRGRSVHQSPPHEDPPIYDPGAGEVTGNWGKR